MAFRFGLVKPVFLVVDVNVAVNALQFDDFCI